MSSILTNLYLSNEILRKPFNSELESKHSKQADEMTQIVGFDTFSEYEAIENELCDARQEMAFKEGFRIAMKLMGELNGGFYLDKEEETNEVTRNI